MTVNIQPFEYIKRKNIDEHNQIVDKLNEIVDSINNVGIEGIPALESDVTTLKADVGQLKISDAENVADIAQAQRDISAHASEISAIKVKNDEQDGRITENGKTIAVLTKEMPTEITLYRDGTGKIRAQVGKEDSTTFDSNTLDMIIPYQYDIISGTTNRSFKLKVSFSDGSTATTNDFIIPEGGGTDVTVTGITLSKDTNNSNKFKASIVLSDSTTIDSGYLEMVTAVSATFTNKKLIIKVNGVESVPIAIDTGITYTGGNGITITGGTISIDSTIVALKSDIPDVSGFATKTELNAVDSKIATKADSSTVQQIQSAVGDCFNEVSIDGNVLTLTATDGQSNSVSLPAGGEEWTDVNLSDVPTLALGDTIRIGLRTYASFYTVSSWSTAPRAPNIKTRAYQTIPTLEFKIGDINQSINAGHIIRADNTSMEYVSVMFNVYSWNNPVGTSIRVQYGQINGAGNGVTDLNITKADIPTYVAWAQIKKG